MNTNVSLHSETISCNKSKPNLSFSPSIMSQETLNYQIIDAISASIYLKDINGVYLDCNKYMLKISGLKNRSQIKGKTDYDFPWRDQAEKIRLIDQIVIDNNKTYHLEETPLINEGVVKTFMSSKTPLYDNEGKIVGIIGVSIDITETKKTEKFLELTEKHLEKSLTLKERFLRNIDHETRNPMQAFVTTSEILVEKWHSLSEKKKYEIALLISDSANRLAELVNKTFDLSKYLKNDVKLKLVRTDITKVIESVIKSCNDSLSLIKRQQIVIKQPKSYVLVFDKQQIRQVIESILSNALKWTDLDEVITIELNKDFLPNSNISAIYCRITNKGVQIPLNELKLIFDPFTESSNTASKACGVGLGLALCKEIIRAHRGEIWAENNDTSGVSFTFAIPTNLRGYGDV